ncbi:hypothetical protein D3C85_1750240 [compost metagenome]
MLAIQAFAALQDSRALVGWYAGAVILDAQLDAAERLPHADAHFAQAQAIGVFQQVAEHFQQGALLNGYMARGRQVK